MSRPHTPATTPITLRLDTLGDILKQHIQQEEQRFLLETRSAHRTYAWQFTSTSREQSRGRLLALSKGMLQDITYFQTTTTTEGDYHFLIQSILRLYMLASEAKELHKSLSHFIDTHHLLSIRSADKPIDVPLTTGLATFSEQELSLGWHLFVASKVADDKFISARFSFYDFIHLVKVEYKKNKAEYQSLQSCFIAMFHRLNAMAQSSTTHLSVMGSHTLPVSAEASDDESKAGDKTVDVKHIVVSSPSFFAADKPRLHAADVAPWAACPRPMADDTVSNPFLHTPLPTEAQRQLTAFRADLGIADEGLILSKNQRKFDAFFGRELTPERFAGWRLIGCAKGRHPSAKGNQPIAADKARLADGWYQYVILAPSNEFRFLPTSPTDGGHIPYQKYNAHSELCGDTPIYAAGAFLVKDGSLVSIDKSSGHYDKGMTEKNTEYACAVLAHLGFDIRRIKIDCLPYYRRSKWQSLKRTAKIAYVSWASHEPGLEDHRPTPPQCLASLRPRNRQQRHLLTTWENWYQDKLVTGPRALRASAPSAPSLRPATNS